MGANLQGNRVLLAWQGSSEVVLSAPRPITMAIEIGRGTKRRRVIPRRTGSMTCSALMQELR
jgi:hypothetical protein